MHATQEGGVAATASVAVEKVFSPPNPADAASRAVELTLARIIVVEFADAAEVLPHAHPAALTHLMHLLLRVAQGAYDSIYFMAWDIVASQRGRLIAILELVMAVPTIEYFAAAGRSDFASSPIMRTTVSPEAFALPLCRPYKFF